MEYSAIILCAGNGSRTGLSYNKILHKIKGRTVYEHTLDIFLNDQQCKQIIVVTKETEITTIKTIVSDSRIIYVMGGKERQDSVYQGLQVVSSPHVMIHDGARPYVNEKEIKELLKCLQSHEACLLMVPVKDTIKKVQDGKVVKTLKRATLMQAQTPQAFHTELIKQVYQKAKDVNYSATDDASLVEVFSDIDVHVVIGSYQNKKITTIEDL